MSDLAIEQSQAQVSGATSSDDSENDVRVETLVAGRTKRTTAGNRLNKLLEKEGDDELELLFAEDEDEEDVEFEGEDGEVASDVELDSSSDDDDVEHGSGQENLEGERELQKQDRAERRKKQKAAMVIKRPLASRVKAKLDPTTQRAGPITPAPRLKRKSERVSWLPNLGEGNLRSSSRKQTVQNKQIVHARMQENETKRRQQIEVMEMAARKKEAYKRKALTQADRLAEADQTERRNAKSLNRWETTEEKRLEKQRADLAELKKRQLKKPFVSWWSGPSRWKDGKLVAVGASAIACTDGDHDKARGTLSKALSESIKVKDLDPKRTAGPGEPVSTDKNSPGKDPMLQEVSENMLQRPASDSLRQDDQERQTQMSFPFESRDFEPSALTGLSTDEISARNLVILEGVDGNIYKSHVLQSSVFVRKKSTARTTSE